MFVHFISKSTEKEKRNEGKKIKKELKILSVNAFNFYVYFLERKKLGHLCDGNFNFLKCFHYLQLTIRV